MNFLEWTGAIALAYLGISAIICLGIIIIYASTQGKSFFANKGLPWKLPLIFIFLMLSWPLLMCQIAEMSFENNSCGYME